MIYTYACHSDRCRTFTNVLGTVFGVVIIAHFCSKDLQPMEEESTIHTDKKASQLSNVPTQKSDFEEEK